MSVIPRLIYVQSGLDYRHFQEFPAIPADAPYLQFINFLLKKASESREIGKTQWETTVLPDWKVLERLMNDGLRTAITSRGLDSQGRPLYLIEITWEAK